MQVNTVVGLPPPSRYDDPILELKAFSQHIKSQLNEKSGSPLRRITLHQRLRTISSTLSQPCFTPALESLQERRTELKGYCPKASSIERLVLCFLNATELAEQAKWLSKDKKLVIETGSRLLQGGEAFLFQELFLRIKPEAAIRYLLSKEKGQLSLAECIERGTSLAKQMKREIKRWVKREVSLLGLFFGQCLRYGHLQEADLLAKQAGQKRCFKAFNP